MKNQNTRKGGCLFTIIKWIALLVVLVGVVYYFFGGLIVSQAIKGVGKMANVDMGGDVSINLTDQEIKISNFYIANPQPEYTKATAISFGEVFMRAKITLAALKKEAPLESDEIRISAPRVQLEKEKNSTLLSIMSKNNIKEIENRFLSIVPQNKSGASEEQAKPEAVSEEKADSKPMKIRINKVVFEDGMLSYSSGKNVSSVKLPSFTIEGIGSQEGGTTVSGAIVDIISNFSIQTLSSIKNLALDIGSAAGDITKDETDEITKQLKDIFKLLKK